MFESSNPNTCLYPGLRRLQARGEPDASPSAEAPQADQRCDARLSGSAATGATRPSQPAAARARRASAAPRARARPGSAPRCPPRRPPSSQNALPSRYWRSLSSSPSSRSDHLAQPAPARPPRLEALAKAGIAGIEPPGGGVHDVLGVALDHRHRRLEAIEGARLLGPGEQARRDRRAGPCEPLRAGRCGDSRRASCPSEPRSSRAEAPPISCSRSSARCGRSQGTERELDRVGALVDRDPAQEEVGILAELEHVRRRGWGPRTPAAAAVSRRHQRDVVLAEHLARPVADRDPGLGAGRGARQRAGEAPERPREREPVGDPALELAPRARAASAARAAPTPRDRPARAAAARPPGCRRE